MGLESSQAPLLYLTIQPVRNVLENVDSWSYHTPNETHHVEGRILLLDPKLVELLYQDHIILRSSNPNRNFLDRSFAPFLAYLPW